MQGIAHKALGHRPVQGVQQKAADHIAQFADIARPVMIAEIAQHPPGQARRPQIPLPGKLADEVFNQNGNVVLSLPQRRQTQDDRGQAVKEITPQAAFNQGLFQVYVGGGQHADIHADGARLAHPLKGVLLHDLQELALHIRRKLADFIQKQGSALGHFNPADALGVGPGERALGIAEHLALKQGRGQGRAVHLDEIGRPPGAAPVQPAGQHALARAGLADDQHRNMQLGDLARHGHDPGHVLGFQQAVHQPSGGAVRIVFTRRIQGSLLRRLGPGPALFGEHHKQKNRQYRTQFQQKIQNLHHIVRLTHKGNVQGADDFAVQDQRQGDGGVEPG